MRNPADYLAEVQTKHPHVLESQWIPTDPDLWQVERYLDFLAARRELLAASAQSFLDSLRASDAPHGEANLQPLQVAPEVVDDPRSTQVRSLIDELERRGFAAPIVDAEIADPTSGTELAVAEAFWPDGLQHGVGEPVVLELDAEGVDLPRLEELGYKVFTSVDALLGFVENESAAAAGEPLPAATEPAPDTATTGGLAEEFGRRMAGIYQRAVKEANYNATHFRSMLSQLGPLETARKLLAAPTVSDGFAALWERGRVDLTVEALVVDPYFSELFGEDEIQVATRRLEQFGYSH